MGLFNWLEKKVAHDEEYVARLRRIETNSMQTIGPNPVRELVLGAPVESIIKAMLNVEDWEVDSSLARYSLAIKYVMTHKTHGLSITYDELHGSEPWPSLKMTKILSCTLTWTTKDENEALCIAYRNYERLKAEAAERERVQLAEVERSKFMVFIPKDE